jgi:hypothetical protein
MPSIPLDLNNTDTSYTRNRWGLPGLDEPLGSQGAVGSAILKEAQEAIRKAEEKERRMEETAKRRNGSIGVNKPVKPNYKQPLFNGVTGRPVKDEYGRYFKHDAPKAGVGKSLSSEKSVTGNAGKDREGRAVFTQLLPPGKNDWTKSAFFVKEL